MSNYRRHYHAGGTYFFTVNLLQRHENDLLIRHIDNLRQAIKTVKAAHLFDILAWVVLPEHMDYIHYNPVKHGLVASVKDWEYSTFHHWVNEGVYSIDWCEDAVANLVVGERLD